METGFLAVMVVLTLVGIASGYPVAFVLGGIPLVVAFAAHLAGAFDLAFVSLISERIWGIANNTLLLSVPLFIFMGATLERAKIAEDLLHTFGLLFGPIRGGMAIAVTAVGALLAASTGVVGASVITMGLLALPTMIKYNYSHSLACGSICAAGTLGQILPPSIVLIILADRVSATYQRAQMDMGNFAPDIVSVLDLFLGAIVPGFLIVVLFALWQAAYAYMRPGASPPIPYEERAQLTRRALATQFALSLLPPVFLIVLVLGSILTGIATPTEGAAVGAMGALVLAAGRRSLNGEVLRDVVQSTAKLSCMIFSILIGAAMFTLVFRGFGGEEIVHRWLSDLPGGTTTGVIIVLAAIFLLGFLLDFIEIIFIVIPIVGGPLFQLGVDPIWFAILVAVNLQTSFLTPPFGFSLFYLRSVAPESIRTVHIYRGVVPFVLLQLLALTVVFLVPELATWLPTAVYG